jgi:probable F420-dependent oxidoreductase
MQLGVSLPSAGPSSSGVSIRDAAAWANELGFDSVWVSDHIVMPARVDSSYPYSTDHRWPFPADYKWFDPLLSLAWAASAAPDVQLGTSVIILPLRDPVLLAKQIASLDSLTNRQVLLGVGVGWMREEFNALGRPFENRGRRSEEIVEAMRRIWSGAQTTFGGDFVTMSELTAHPIPGHTPLVLWGGHSLACLRRVARLGDGWHPLGLTKEEFEAGRIQLEQFCAKESRDSGSLTVSVAVGTSQRLTSDECAWYMNRGVDHLICSPPRDPGEYVLELKRIAKACDLQHR